MRRTGGRCAPGKERKGIASRPAPKRCLSFSIPFCSRRGKKREQNGIASRRAPKAKKGITPADASKGDGGGRATLSRAAEDRRGSMPGSLGESARCLPPARHRGPAVQMWAGTGPRGRAMGGQGVRGAARDAAARRATACLERRSRGSASGHFWPQIQNDSVQTDSAAASTPTSSAPNAKGLSAK